MIRFGLCCIFIEHDINFRKTTASFLNKLTKKEQIAKLSNICVANAESLFKAVQTINTLNIKSFRITSPLFPLYTHPEQGYKLEDLNTKIEILSLFEEIKTFVKNNNIRLSFHPDQFNVLCSPNPKVVTNSIRELDYQASISELISADVINIHVGGAYNSKIEAIKRFADVFKKLPNRVKQRLTIENDDKIYTPSDVLELCQKINRPLIYDAHHHRCNPDSLTIEEATNKCFESWQNNGEAYFHISSPKNGWQSTKPQPHADYIDINDFPKCWLHQMKEMTIDIEAKAKEKAVIKLMKTINQQDNDTKLITRIEYEENIEKAEKLGATEIVSPTSMAASHIVSSSLL